MEAAEGAEDGHQADVGEDVVARGVRLDQAEQRGDGDRATDRPDHPGNRGEMAMIVVHHGPSWRGAALCREAAHPPRWPGRSGGPGAVQLAGHRAATQPQAPGVAACGRSRTISGTMARMSSTTTPTKTPPQRPSSRSRRRAAPRWGRRGSRGRAAGDDARGRAPLRPGPRSGPGLPACCERDESPCHCGEEQPGQPAPGHASMVRGRARPTGGAAPGPRAAPWYMSVAQATRS